MNTEKGTFPINPTINVQSNVEEISGVNSLDALEDINSDEGNLG